MHSLNLMTPTRRECGAEKINNSIQFITKLSTALSGIGLIAWGALKANPDFLPAPTTKIGRQILRQYQGTVADIFLGLTIATITYLLFKIISSQKKEARSKASSDATSEATSSARSEARNKARSKSRSKTRSNAISNACCQSCFLNGAFCPPARPRSNTPLGRWPSKDMI